MGIPKVRPNISAEQAQSPFNRYDSSLEFPKRTSMLYKQQNAWLTLKMRIRLNFIDPGDQSGDLTHHVNGKWYAKDADDELLPIRPWTAQHREKFRKSFKKEAEETWNYQFVLQTPINYAGLDHTVSTWNEPVAHWRVRPNVICLYRLDLVNKNQHYTIDVVDLNFMKPREVYEYNKKHGTNIRITWGDGGFRSDMRTLTFQDSARTIGHEIGHGLGQAHIMPLLGKKCSSSGPEGFNARDCYGKSKMERDNIMGRRDRIYLVNAISWQKRMAIHCPGPYPSSWRPTGIRNTPPRKTSEKAFSRLKLL